ncbi:metal-dependent phosphohydrolase [Dactylosporangium sp. NPDC049525]|uniref:HD domain-containing protein n=1 Tax=Dactylosporangium sp. NPDC049525 TaxID=3154730 RepID=UPI003434D143
MVSLADWQRLFPADSAVGASLIERWSEPHRRYHTLDHLAVMLGVIDAHAEIADDADAVRLAAWFHDAIYEPFAPDNEERSALLALSVLPDLGVSADRVAEVARLVRLTAGHSVAAGDRNGALLADADLAILASPPADYARYAAAVRQEYAAVPEDAFRSGRAQILGSFLAEPDLFRAVPARAEWTARAHDNLRAEITTLLGAP